MLVLRPMHNLRSTPRTLGLLLALLVTGLSSCSSSESLPAIKNSQAKKFAKQLAKASCKRLNECLDEMNGEEIPDDMDMTEDCAENFEQTLYPVLKECDAWDKSLAEDCLEDFPEAKCVNGGTIRVESCDELMELCGIENQ